ncbi:hypothetical protein COT97_02340 [Candidatus Falkowbacteria bacterium CG10_big_fil_rev_8_21_14_0_10_39_11]|uniref:Uncharacterized protein n=1 Tax=Candidatus Falkowbacteria bacterium CG10_big_fil_rev_8_21_14_0_10_39_11 TaxID=1974565 RepID=A0A2H0V5G9_9BACT|nr:MAG: hypothetical protein COT97_02340 [Candidatus Falkowbacteria bacterium CG10_big_fil_rev_8_21_14_0_10_39_11]
MSKFFQKINPGDYWDKELPAGQEMRYQDYDLVLANLGPEYQQFLRELKEKNKELNKLLETKIRAANLPFSVKPGTGIFRFSIRFAPPYSKPFMQSPDELEGKATAGERYSPGNDEIVLYLHVDEDYNFLVTRTAAFNAYDASSFTHGLTLHNLKRNSIDQELSDAIKDQDLEKISTLIVGRMKISGETRQIEYVLDVKTIDDAQQKFSEAYLRSRKNTILTNFAQMMIQNILVEQIKNNLDLPEDELKSLLMYTIFKFSEIEFESYTTNKPIKLQNFFKPKIDFGKIDNDKLSPKQIEDYVRTQIRAFHQSLVKRAMDEYRRQKFAKKK